MDEIERLLREWQEAAREAAAATVWEAIETHGERLSIAEARLAAALVNAAPAMLRVCKAAEVAAEETQALLDKMDAEGFEAFGLSRDDVADRIASLGAALAEVPR